MKQLLGNLIEQRNLYKILLAKAQEKQESIIRNNLDSIEALNKDEDQLIRKIAALEAGRLKEIENNPKLYGDDALSLTLEEIKERFPQGIQRLIDKETRELMEVLGELKSINAENAQLLQQALRIVNVTINTITGADESNKYPTDKKKDRAHNKARNLIDRKI